MTLATSTPVQGLRPRPQIEACIATVGWYTVTNGFALAGYIRRLPGGLWQGLRPQKEKMGRYDYTQRYSDQASAAEALCRGDFLPRTC